MTSAINAKAIRGVFLKVEPQKECWGWLGARNKAGYGMCYDGNRVLGASRYIYQIVHGDIAPGLTIDHLCFNKSCVNPWHLEAVTIKENVLRGNSVERGRTRLLRQSQNRINMPIKDFLTHNRNSGKGYKELGQELGVSSKVIAYWCKKLHILKPPRKRAYPSLDPNFPRKVQRSQVTALRRTHPDWTLQQIAESLSISRERVRQILKGEGLPTRREMVVV